MHPKLPKLANRVPMKKPGGKSGKSKLKLEVVLKSGSDYHLSKSAVESIIKTVKKTQKKNKSIQNQATVNNYFVFVSNASKK